MNSTVQVICTSGIERPDLVRIVAVERDIHRWRARLLLRLRRTVDPTPVRNDRNVNILARFCHRFVMWICHNGTRRAKAGISEQHLPSLFDRFYRVDKARSRRQQEPAQSSKPDQEEPDGSGLGLSIVQWIVQAHGGEICVESKPGSGSVFQVRLPLLKHEKSDMNKRKVMA